MTSLPDEESRINALLDEFAVVAQEVLSDVERDLRSGPYHVELRTGYKQTPRDILLTAGGHHPWMSYLFIAPLNNMARSCRIGFIQGTGNTRERIGAVRAVEDEPRDAHKAEDGELWLGKQPFDKATVRRMIEPCVRAFMSENHHPPTRSS